MKAFYTNNNNKTVKADLNKARKSKISNYSLTISTKKY